MATKFRDNNDREWRIKLTLEKVKRIKEEFDLDLLAPWDGRVIDELTKDVMRFAEVMAMAVDFSTETDADVGEALADGMRGEGLDRAILAFWKDLSDFFPGAQRLALQTLVAKSTEAWDAIWNESAKRASEVSVNDILSITSTQNAPQETLMNPVTNGN